MMVDYFRKVFGLLFFLVLFLSLFSVNVFGDAVEGSCGCDWTPIGSSGVCTSYDNCNPGYEPDAFLDDCSPEYPWNSQNACINAVVCICVPEGGCSGSDTSCGTSSCSNCNSDDGCQTNGLYRDGYCSSNSGGCYSDYSCTTTCCEDTGKGVCSGDSCVCGCPDADGDNHYQDDCGQSKCTNFPQDDCDDANANVNPGMTEVCNGMDDNCDGYLLANEYSFSTGVEVCDGLDNDCDGVIDNGCGERIVHQGKSYISANQHFLATLDTDSNEVTMYQLDSQRNVRTSFDQAGLFNEMQMQDYFPFGDTASLGMDSTLKYHSLELDKESEMYLSVYDTKMGRYQIPVVSENKFQPEKFNRYMRTNNPFRIIKSNKLKPVVPKVDVPPATFASGVVRFSPSLPSTQTGGTSPSKKGISFLSFTGASAFVGISSVPPKTIVSYSGGGMSWVTIKNPPMTLSNVKYSGQVRAPVLDNKGKVIKEQVTVSHGVDGGYVEMARVLAKSDATITMVEPGGEVTTMPISEFLGDPQYTMPDGTEWYISTSDGKGFVIVKKGTTEKEGVMTKVEKTESEEGGQPAMVCGFDVGG